MKIRMLSWIRTQTPILIYAGIAFLILGPLLKPGYILTLDMPWTPRLPFPDVVTSSYVLRLLLFALDQILPSQIIQKLLLFSIFVLMGTGLHRLLEWQLRIRSFQIAPYFGGLFYTINPFTYSRLMDGHWNVLFGYALLPFFLRALLGLFQEVGHRQALKLGVWATVIGIVSIHLLYLLLILGLIGSVVFIVQHRQNPKELRAFLISMSIAVGLSFVANAHWLAPLVAGQSEQARQLATFDERHLLSFRTDKDEQFGLPLNVLALYGYWGDDQGRYVLNKDLVPIWPILWAVLFALALIGGQKFWRKSRPVVIVVGLSGLISMILALGTSWRPTADFNRWLLENAPFFEGYREPQKFIAMVALAFAFFGGIGAQVFLIAVNNAAPRLYKTAATSLILLPILYTPLMLWGAAGQLKASDYPADWYEVDAWLQEQPGDYRVLFLPWHQYARFSFAGRVIANPAEHFFHGNIIQSHFPEIGLLYGEAANEDEAWIDRYLIHPEGERTSVTEKLAELRVRYVILAKEADWEAYDYLRKQTSLELISDTESLQIYENKAYNTRGK